MKEKDTQNNGESSQKSERLQPLWETVVMIASFGLLWLWFIARQSALRNPGTPMSPLWQLVLAVSMIALVVIMVRRMKRVKDALEGKDNPASFGMPPGMPYGFGQPPERKGKR